MATAAERLDQARDALHNLVTQKLARVLVDQNGERVEFTQTNINDLRAYIGELELEVSPSTAGKLARPIGFIF
jgi:hypothetical protein